MKSEKFLLDIQTKCSDITNGILKLVSAIFYQFFYFFIKWKAFKNFEKCFLFHLKSFFRSRDIQIFPIFSLPFYTFQIQKGKWKQNN